MCLHFGLWIVIPFYVPLSLSMDRYPGLCAVIPFYVPSFSSMDRYLILWTVILVYGPLSQAMGRYPILWTVIPFYVPSFSSMCHHSVLWTVNRILYADDHQQQSSPQKRKRDASFFMLPHLFLLIRSYPGFGVICRRLLLPYICIQ